MKQYYLKREKAYWAYIYYGGKLVAICSRGTRKWSIITRRRNNIYVFLPPPFDGLYNSLEEAFNAFIKYREVEGGV